MLLRKFKIIILHIFAILFFTSCIGGGTGSSETATSTTKETVFTQLEDLESVAKVSKSLNDLGITNTQELATSLNSQDPLEFFIKLKEKDSSLQSEDLVNLIKDLEQEILLKPLLTNKTITQKAFDSLSLVDTQVDTLKTNDFRVWSSTNQTETLSTTANDEYVKQQWIAYNNKLSGFDQELLTFDEFKNLKNAIKDLQPIFFTIINSMQNVPVSPTVTKSRSFSKAVLDLQENNVLNSVNENNGDLQLSPSDFLKYKSHQFMECRGIEKSYPFHIMGIENTPVNGTNIYATIDTTVPLLGNEDGQRYFQLNETGLAELTLYNKSSTSVDVEFKHKDKILFNTRLEAYEKQKVFIPVFEEDICIPYYMTKDDIKIEANIMGIKKPSDFEKELIPSNGAYDLVNRISSNPNNETFFQSYIMKFSILDYSSESNQIISFINENSTNSSIQYLIKSPSGILTSQINVGSVDLALPRENGTWTIYAIPRIYGESNQYTIDTSTNEITSYYVMKESTSELLDSNYKISLRTNESANRKKFIISEMKNAEFSHDGESIGASAEVKLSLHTNMAPKLDMGKDIENQFQENPQYPAYKCWNDNGRTMTLFRENQICNEFNDSLENIFNMFYTTFTYTSLNEDMKQYLLIKYEKNLAKQLNDAKFRLIYDIYTDVYDEWKNSIIQINDVKFPVDYHYGIQDSIGKASIDNPLVKEYDTFYHPDIPINIPILALTKERMSTTTIPFAFQYSALDEDEVDSSLQIFAVAKYIVNQALAVATGNYAALVCNTVATMQEIRQNEINGEDEPIGEADFFLNRFSTNDQFYGIQNQNLGFSISGNAEVPNHYTSFDEKLEYASLACSGIGAISAGYNLYGSVGGLISGDYFNATELENLKNGILDNLEEGSTQYNEMVAAFDAIKNGTADAQSLATLAAAEKLYSFANGIDIFNNLSDINDTLGGLGSQGYNTMRSEANYFYSSFENRKTRSNITVKEVDSLPVVNTSVTLDSVHIIHNLEDGNAEVKLRTRVGVISDENPTYNGSFASNAPYMIDGELIYDNGTNNYKTLPNLPFKGYLLKSKNYNGIKDGDLLNIGTDFSLYDASYPSSNNTASIYLEIGLFEGDGGGVDDDMIGVLSKTFYLEDLYNNVDGFRWTPLGNNSYRLSVINYPVYDAVHLATSVEVVDAENREKQLAHNKDRINDPSALISFHIDIQLGDFVDHEIINVEDAIVDNNPNTAKEPMDYSLLNLKERNFLLADEMRLYDVYNNKAIIYDYEDQIKIANIDENKNLSWGLGINSAALEEQYKPLIQLRSHSRFTSDAINNISFIDTNNLLVFKKEYVYFNEQARLAILDIKDGDTYGDVRGEIKFPIGSAPIHVTTKRVDENTIQVFAILPNVDQNDGKILVYTVTKDSIILTKEQVLAHVPQDILLIDDETVLLKSAKIKHVSYDDYLNTQEYWIDETYLTLYEFKDNTFRPIDIRQYTFSHHSYNKGTGLVNPFGSSLKNKMKNINSGTVNRLAKVKVINYNYEDSTFVGVINLIYNADNKNYRFGDVQKERVHANNYIENDVYPYFLSDWLTVYPDDLKSDTLNFPYTKIFEEDIKYEAKESVFLDSRYILAIGHKLKNDLSINSDALSIIDTFHIDNTAPEIFGTDFEQVHIMEYSNNFHTSINFKVVDNESSIDDLNVTFTQMNPETNEEYYTGTDTNDVNFLQRAKLTCSSDGNCNMTIDLPLKDSSIKTKFRINVQDDNLLTQKYFTTWLAKSEPNIYSYPPLNITLKNEDEYNKVDFEIISQNEISNGYIDEFIIENKPDWITSSEYIYGSKILRLQGTPPLGSIGTYDIKVTAKNDRFEDVEHYIINVIEPDTTPNDFSLQTFEDVELSTLVTKDIVVDGINGYAPISIVNGEYSIDDSGIWKTTESLVTNTSLVKVRHTSSDEYSTETITTLNIGGKTSQLVSRTITDPTKGDFTPNQFTFTDITNTELSTIVTSNITIAGINEIVNLSISNGEYSFNNKDWFTSNTTVENTQQIFVRHTSSNLYSSTVNTILTVGGISDTFSSTTMDIPVPILEAQIIPTYEVGQVLNLNINNIGGVATSWSIANNPAWMMIDTTTGNISGTTQAGNFSNILITATNNSGSDDFILNLSVNSKNYPNINSGSHTIDENEMDFTFTDDQDWRDSIESITIQEDYGQDLITLVEGSDYTLVEGKLSLIVNGINNIPTKAGNWIITIKATNYYDCTIQVYVQNGSIDILNAQNTLSVSNAPLRQGKVSNIKFQALDRFGNTMSYKEVYFDMVITNDDNTFNEPYLIKGIDETIYNNFINLSYSPSNRHSYYTDENGWVEIMIKVPACIDVSDGFEIVIKDTNETVLMTTPSLISSISLENSTTVCTDDDWIKRFGLDTIYNMKLQTDTDGNVYVAGNTTANIEGVTNLGGDIYLSKIDRNGVTKWEKLLGSSEYDLFNDFIIDGTSLYLAITTNGSLDNNANAGLQDAGLLKVSTIDGSLIFANQVGDVNDDLAIGVSKTASEINLYVNKNSQSFIYKYNLDGTFISSKDLLDNHTKLIADSENNHLSIINKSISKYDENGDLLLSRGNVGGADYYMTGLFTLDTNSNNDIYTTGQTKLKLFDEEVIDTSYHGTIIKRNKNGNYQWSKILGEGNLITTGGTTTIDGITYVIYTQRNDSSTSTPRNMYMKVINDIDGVVLGSYTWEAGTVAYNTITSTDIISDATKHSLYIGANVYGNMLNTNTADGSNVIIKKQQYDVPQSVIGYSRSDYLNIITDYDNHLQWVDTSNFINQRVFDNASNYCSNEVNLDDNDSNSSWRLPTNSELTNTINSSNTPAIESVFQIVDTNTAYWTNEEIDISNVEGIYYWGAGGADSFPKTDSLLIRCVRDN